MNTEFSKKYGIDPQLLNLDCWAALAPSLKLSASLAPSGEFVDFGQEEIQKHVSGIRNEGYLITKSLVPPETRNSLINGIDELVSRRFNPTWALLYDDFWNLFMSMRPLAKSILGDNYKYVTGNYIFIVDNTDSASGWGVHRDLPFRNSIREDGLPDIMSLWVALTDATPLNSCLYCLPASRDPNYPHNLPNQSIQHVEDIECMAVQAGQVIGLNHGLLHWGSRSSSRGASRRVSFVFDIQRGDVPCYHEALLDPTSPITFEQRAAYVGHVLLWLSRYNVRFSSRDLKLADAMVREYGHLIGVGSKFLDTYAALET